MAQVLAPVRQRRTAELIAGEVERAIDRDFLAVGQRLPNERQLADELGVSRASLREALRILEERQVVVVRRGRGGGTFVLPRQEQLVNRDEALSLLATQTDHIRQLLQFRRVIEVEIAALACGRLSADDVDILQTLNAQMHDDPPRRTYRALDTQFHLQIAGATGNTYLIDAHRTIRADINQALDVLPSSLIRRQQSHQEHVRLLEALVDDKSREARRLMEQHIAKTEQLLLFTLEARQEGALI
jgi:DNA-binding FadR family transcriptional regulator